METAQSGMTLSEAGKQYSQASTAALKKLDSLDRKFEGLNERIEGVATTIHRSTGDNDSPHNLMQLVKAKNELAQIAGDLERLQCRELDAIETAELTSGKNEARTHRKSLNQAVENLMRRTQDLHQEFVATVEKLQTEAASLEASSPLKMNQIDTEIPMHSLDLPEPSVGSSDGSFSEDAAGETDVEVSSPPLIVSPVIKSESAHVAKVDGNKAAIPISIGNKNKQTVGHKSEKNKIPVRHVPARPVQHEYFQPYPDRSRFNYFDEPPQHYINGYRKQPDQYWSRSRQPGGGFHPAFYF